MTKFTEKIKLSNFSFRLDDDLRGEVDRISKKRGVSSATLVREAVAFYLHKIQVEEELELLSKTSLRKLPLLINTLRTKEGNDELQRRFIEAIDIVEEKES